MTRLCIDYDYTKYQCGFASETRHIVVTHKNSKDVQVFDNRSEFYGRDRKSGWLADFNEGRTSPHSIDEYDIVDVQEMRPFKQVKDIVRTSVLGLCKHLQTRDYYGWLGRGKVFRHEQATIQEYKSGRNNLKPLALDIIEELLLTEYNGRLATDSLEADDWLCIDSHEAWKDWIKTKHQRDRLIVVTPDKDARQCEKSHLFNPDTMKLPMTINGFGKLYWKENTATPSVTGHGRIWLYGQIILGDKVDAYCPRHLYNKRCEQEGISPKRFGDTAAFNLLSKCTTDKEALEAIVKQYKVWYPEPFVYQHWQTGQDIQATWLTVAEEMWMLARMKRWLGDDAKLEDVLKTLEIEY